MRRTGSVTAGHHGFVKSQERRDEQTVTSFAGLLLFLLVTVAGAVALVIVHQFVELKGSLLNVLVYGVLGGAAVVSIRYIYRNRGR
jgi:hypothetical protein